MIEESAKAEPKATPEAVDTGKAVVEYASNDALVRFLILRRVPDAYTLEVELGNGAFSVVYSGKVCSHFLTVLTASINELAILWPSKCWRNIRTKIFK